jgi:2-C-methyl-D-erythritol 4-phosphate cytidylyltransferase
MDGIDKMLVPIAGRPMLAWTLEALAASPVVERMVVVASAGNIAEISGAPWLPALVTRVVVGGARRQGSVSAGVDALGQGPAPPPPPTGSSSSTMAPAHWFPRP